MSIAAEFNSPFYIANHVDVASAIRSGDFESAFDHFIIFGGLELRAPNPIFDPAYYIHQNPKVHEATISGHFRNVFEHYQLFGERENRAPMVDFEGFNPTLYFAENPDVRAAFDIGHFVSALDHYISFGKAESRPGTGITLPEVAFELTPGKDNFIGTAGDDLFFGLASFFGGLDKIDGRGGVDTLELSYTNTPDLAILPDISNLRNIEQLTITDTEHQTLDFSGLAQITKIELKSGVTKNGQTITATLGENQTLTLTSIKDGDTKGESLSSGGIKINQSDAVSRLDLFLSDVGMASGRNFQHLIVDLAGKGVSSLNIKNEKTSAILFKNSGGSLLSIDLEARANIDLADVPETVTAINASGSVGSIKLLLKGENTSARTGTGNDDIKVLGGTNSVLTGEGHDRIAVTGGNSGINTGSGSDQVVLANGNNDLNTGLGNDTVILNGGINTANTGSGNDRAFIGGGQQTLNLGSGQDSVDIIGGDSTINTGSGNDIVSLSEGFSNIQLGEGNDILSVTNSLNLSNYRVAGGPGTDRINIIHNGSISFPGAGIFSGIEDIFVSNSTHQSIDLSGFTGVENVTLSSGTTADGSTITTTLGLGQKLILEGITDGDTGAASLSDGGLEIVQGASITSLDLKLDDVGPSSSTANENLFIDIAGQGTSTVNLESEDTNFIVLSNSGGSLSNLNVIGSGPLGLIFNSPGTINTTSLSALLTLTGSSSGNTITSGAGNDTITLSGGTNMVDSGSGNDSITLSNGSDTINSGPGNDVVVASSGTNIIQTEDGDDQITVSGGVNEVRAGNGNDIVTASGGSSNVNIRVLDGGAGIDTLRVISTGTVALPTSSGFENIFISDTVHQSLDFSLSASVTEIELDSGSTIDGDTITTTLAAGQALILDSIIDGDTSSASLADGGIIIAQANSISSLDLTLDDVGPASSLTNENVFIDIAGTGVSSAKITSGNDSFVVISNSGGALTGLELLGTGSIALGTLPTSITNVNGAAASANLTLTIGTGTNTIRGGTGNDAITLTGGTNDVQTGDGDDIITTANNLVPGDRIDGGNGSDTFEVIHTGLATIPSTANLISIENISIQDTVHQTLDFSMLTTITGIELDSGTTIDGATINTTLGTGQSLKLDSITDGDTAAASLADGGIKVIQPNSSTSLDLTLDDIGPAAASTNQNVFIDIAAANVANLNITSANDSFVVLENSGGSLASINISGSGALGLIGAMANSITTIDANSSSANLTLTTGTAGTTVTGGSGNDSITLSGGNNNVTSGDGGDTINLGSGNDTVNTGSGDDNVVASAGTNNITTGSNNDQITISGGSNTVNTGNNNDVVNISNGNNNITTGSNNDQITISGGSNTVNTGNNNDVVNISNGNNNINSGSGSDQITVSGGTNTIVTGNNNDTVNASGGNNDIDTDAGNDQVVLTGGTNDVNTGNNNDTVTLSSGTDTVDMGSGNDTLKAGNNLSAADTVNGGSGTQDKIEITAAMTDALAARLSNFEVLEIKGSGGITHDISGLTGLTSLQASGALTGAIVITDLAEAAEVDISAALGNDLTINQINSAGGSDTLTIDFRGGGYTTGGSIIVPNIETVTVINSQGSSKVVSGGTFANATNVTITATSNDLTITDLTAVNMTALDASSSNNKVNITTGTDVFSGAFTFSSGNQDDTLDFDGATLVAGSVFELGNGQDTLTLNADAVATVVRTSASGSSASDNAFSVRDDATSANTASFTSGSDTFDYNGSLSHDSVTSVVAASGATLQAAVAADSDATVYVIRDANGDAGLETAINTFADDVSTGGANTLETEAVDTGLLSYTGLDSAFDSSDIVLIAIDSETNEDATTANNGGTAVYRFHNSNTSTVDTVLSSELELIGVFQDAALNAADFI